MTKVSVSEYAMMPKDAQGAIIPIPPEPPLATQTIDYTAGVASITLGPQTRYVRLNNDSICAMRFDGTNAATTDARSPAETIEFKGVQPNGKISAITTT
jgi:hypothetical protein